MSTPKLLHILTIIDEELSKAGVPYAMIGAMALALYGIPRYTAAIDLLSDDLNRETLLSVMADLGYQCFSQTDIFAQFDSADGTFGKVDYLLVHTDEGRAILQRSILVQDDLIGRVPVVQPTDYAVLKLMAMANNKERRGHDGADLATLLKASAAGLISTAFAPLDREHLEGFAQRFRISKLLASLMP